MSRRENLHAKYLFDIFIYLPLLSYLLHDLPSSRSLIVFNRQNYPSNKQKFYLHKKNYIKKIFCIIFLIKKFL